MKKSFWGYQAKEVDEAIDALTKQNTSLIQRNDHLEDELKNMHVQLEEMKANVAHSMTQAQFDEYKELKAAYAALQNRMQDEVEDSETVKELQAQLEAAKQEAEDADRQSQEAREELQAQLEAAKQETEEANRQNQATREELIVARDEASSAKEALETERSESERVKAELESVKNDASALKEEVHELRLQAAEIPDDRELREARRQYQETLEELQAVRAGQQEAQEETRAVRAQQQELQGKFETAQAELRGAKEEITAKEEELVRKDAELHQKDELLTGKDLQLQESEARLVELQTQLTEREEALSEKDAELAQMKEQAAQPAFVRQRDMGMVELNEMMKRVGDAIYETKSNTYHNMMGAVDEFVRQWEASNGQLEEILVEFDAEKDKTRQELLDTVQMILHQFDRMAQKSETMHANLRNLTSKRSELREKLELTVEQLRSEPTEKTEGKMRDESLGKEEEQPETVTQAQAPVYESTSDGTRPDEGETVFSQNRDTDMLGSRRYGFGAEKRIFRK